MISAAGAVQAEPLNWEGTLTTTAGSVPPIPVAGGGVATVNGSSGPIPAHVETLRLAASRGSVAGTVTHLVTDPETAGNGIAAVVVEGALLTGTLAPISGATASATPLTQRVLPGGSSPRTAERSAFPSRRRPGPSTPRLRSTRPMTTPPPPKP
jgi:hypothetical protein